MQISLEAIEIEEEAREEAKELALCQADYLHFINEQVKTLDPRVAPYILPFRLYDYQVETLRELEERYTKKEDLFIEKSRDMGVTWLILAWIIWKWRFQPGFQALIGSRKEEYVDGLPESLFHRFELILNNLPGFLLPVGYDNKKHRMFRKLLNPENGNSISGEATNPEFSRQGRYSVVFLDEFGIWPYAQSAWTATADSTPCRIIATTAGHNRFVRDLRYSGRVQVKSLHWRLHPKKDEAWYAKEQDRRTEYEIAQELEINWEGSIQGRVYPEWEDIAKGEFPYQPGWVMIVSWDFGHAPDPTSILWWQQNPQTAKWRLVDCLERNGKTIDWFAPFCTGQKLSGLPYKYTEKDIEKIEQHMGWGIAIHCGDPAGNIRNQVTGTSVIKELGKFGIHINTKPNMNTFEARYHSTKLFLREIEGINLPACLQASDAISEARFPERSEESQAVSGITKPIHDWTSHYRTSLEFRAVNPPAAKKRTIIPRTKAFWESM